MEFEKLKNIIGEVLSVDADDIDIEIANEEAEKIRTVGDAVEKIKNALNN